MYKIDNSCRGRCVEQVYICTRSLVVVRIMPEAGKCVYKLDISGLEHGVNQVSVCTIFVTVVRSMA